MTWVKICGITNPEDAYNAVRFGADALGFNFFRGSPRFIDPNLAAEIIVTLPGHIEKIAVFVNEVDEQVTKILSLSNWDYLQFHGDESPAYCQKFNHPFIKAFRVEREADLKDIPRFVAGPDQPFLLDAFQDGQFGGTGKTFDWHLAILAKQHGAVILSGGLNPENIKTALIKVNPSGVDVASGVEKKPGKKDPAKMRDFIDAVRRWDLNKKKKQDE